MRPPRPSTVVVTCCKYFTAIQYTTTVPTEMVTRAFVAKRLVVLSLQAIVSSSTLQTRGMNEQCKVAEDKGTVGCHPTLFQRCARACGSRRPRRSRIARETHMFSTHSLPVESVTGPDYVPF